MHQCACLGWHVLTLCGFANEAWTLCWDGQHRMVLQECELQPSGLETGRLCSHCELQHWLCHQWYIAVKQVTLNAVWLCQICFSIAYCLTPGLCICC